MNSFGANTNTACDMTRQLLLREYSNLRESLKKISVFCEAVVDGRVLIVSENEVPIDCISNKHSAISYCSAIAFMANEALEGPSVTDLVSDLHLYDRKE